MKRTSHSAPEFLMSTPKAIQWLRGQQSAYVPSDRDELAQLRASVAGYLRRIKAFFRDGVVPLYRAVLLPDGASWTQALRTDRMGLSWTLERSSALVYFSPSGESFSADEALDGTVVEALVEPTAVDWETSLVQFSTYGEDEWEVRLLPEQTIAIVAIDGQRLVSPIVGNTGSTRERWRSNPSIQSGTRRSRRPAGSRGG